MRISCPPVVHVSPRVQARGGIESLHARHRTLSWPQAFVALVDRNPEARAGYTNLNFTWRTTLGRMRREFSRAMAPHAGAVVIYHNTWALPLLHAGDHARRRLALCHAMPGFHRRDLPPCDGLLDGVLGVSPAMTAAWPEQLPQLGAGRDVILPLPIEPPAGLVTDRVAQSPLVLGYLGRVVREQKRMDRLPALLAALDAAGLEYRFEVIGDGSLRPQLEQTLAGRVQFHGWVSEAEKWRILSRWDAVLFLTDNEGGPIAMLEAMAAGCLPFFPQLHGSLGDAYAPRVDARCHYPSGDLAVLAAAVRGVFAEPSGAVLARREIARRLVAGHTPEAYAGALADFVARIAALPAVAATDPDRGHWSDAWPLGLVNRVAPWLLRRRR